MMDFIGKLVGIVFACFLLRLAFKFFHKEKHAQSVFALWAAVFILLCSFSWFQGWAKSFIASNLIGRLTAITEQVNTVQSTTSEMLNQYSNQVNALILTNEAMHTQLVDHQTQIKKQQNELGIVQAKIREAETNIVLQQADITNQFRQVSSVQSNLGAAQTNLNEQAIKLSDIEYWARNLYDNMNTESISISDTNHVFILPITNDNKIHLCFSLSHAPVRGSVEAYARDPSSMGEARLAVGKFVKNASSFTLTGFDSVSTVFYFRYVADTRQTQIYSKIPTLSSGLSYDTNSGMIYFP